MGTPKDPPRTCGACKNASAYSTSLAYQLNDIMYLVYCNEKEHVMNRNVSGLPCFEPRPDYMKPYDHTLISKENPLIDNFPGTKSPEFKLEIPAWFKVQTRTFAYPETTNEPQSEPEKPFSPEDFAPIMEMDGLPVVYATIYNRRPVPIGMLYEYKRSRSPDRSCGLKGELVIDSGGSWEGLFDNFPKLMYHWCNTTDTTATFTFWSVGARAKIIGVVSKATTSFIDGKEMGSASISFDIIDETWTKD